MTDMPTGKQLGANRSQLPIASYFDPSLLAREKSLLFARGPGYVGHELMVPEVGSYMVLEPTAHSKMLMRSRGGVHLLANVCRHRQSLLLQGRGTVQNIVCPLHRWTYDLDGRLMGAPEFAENPGLDLAQTPLHSWHGLQFTGPRDAARDLADFPLAEDYDFSGYVFDHARVEHCHYNWKNFLEIYLELYHVIPFHPGLQKFVDPGNYEWGFGERWSYQILGLKDELKFQVSPNYTRYRDAILSYGGGKLPKYGTVWSILYPNVMLEWYPYALVVSTLWPVGVEHTINLVEFYYPEEVSLFEVELKEAHLAAYAESAAEDNQICTWLHNGRKALWLNGTEDAGPYHSPHEDGMVHFHEYWRREIGV
jgi:phenylpropionate dioxygenase-like ring-hydroxylating dioxygenase large terminal subunit